MVVSSTSHHIQIKIKMPNPSQEPPASSKAPNEELKDMNDLSTFKVTEDIQNFAFSQGLPKKPNPKNPPKKNKKKQSNTPPKAGFIGVF